MSLLAFLSSRLAVATLAVLGTLLLSSALRTASPPPTTFLSVHDLTATHASPRGFRDRQRVLVLTPLKDGAAYLDDYFANLARLSYPPHLISLAFLVSDSTDTTVQKLNTHAERIAKGPRDKRYHDITILQKDFHFNLASEVRHGFEGQPVRRAFIARARNYLLTSALKPDHAWVLWLDVDVVRYDPDILMDLMSIAKDIVVPNTLWYQPDSWEFWVSLSCPIKISQRMNASLSQGFDRNNFAETEDSLKLLSKLGPDILLVEGAL